MLTFYYFLRWLYQPPSPPLPPHIHTHTFEIMTVVSHVLFSKRKKISRVKDANQSHAAFSCHLSFIFLTLEQFFSLPVYILCVYCLSWSWQFWRAHNCLFCRLSYFSNDRYLLMRRNSYFDKVQVIGVFTASAFGPKKILPTPNCENIGFCLFISMYYDCSFYIFVRLWSISKQIFCVEWGGSFVFIHTYPFCLSTIS